MYLHCIPLNPYLVNTYIVAAEDGECAIIDPGCCSPKEQQFLKDYIDENELVPIWLINTHGHYDHVVGNAFVCKTWNVKSAIHCADLQMIKHTYQRAEIFGFPVEEPPTPTVFLEEGNTVRFGDDGVLEVIHVPGHSPGSIVLYVPFLNWLFTGDVLFENSIGRTDFPGCDHDLLVNGIKTKLLRLPDIVHVYPGHGGSTTIGSEKRSNRFLQD